MAECSSLKRTLVALPLLTLREHYGRGRRKNIRAQRGRATKCCLLDLTQQLQVPELPLQRTGSVESVMGDQGTLGSYPSYWLLVDSEGEESKFSVVTEQM